MKRARIALALLALGRPGAASAQEAKDLPGAEMREVAAAAPQTASAESDPAVWDAGLSAGLLDRDGGQATPYATLSLTRYRGAATCAAHLPSIAAH